MKYCVNSKCGAENPDNANFCRKCGSELRHEQFETLEFTASLRRNLFTSETGRLCINSTNVVFRPSSLSNKMLKQSERRFDIKDIIGYSKGTFTSLTIYLYGREPFLLAVFKKDAIINALETRRVAYFKSVGVEAPKLQV